MPAITLCYSKLDSESRLTKNHTTTIALKGKKEFAASTNIKMQDICTVLWGFCKREHVDATWLHFPYVMVLVHLLLGRFWVGRLGDLCITVASLFSNVIKTIPAWLTEGGFGVLIWIKPLWEPPFSVAKQVILHILKPDCIFTQPVLTFALSRTDAWVSSVAQIRITSTSKHQFWKTEMCQLSKESLPVMLLAGQLLSYLTEYIG